MTSELVSDSEPRLRLSARLSVHRAHLSRCFRFEEPQQGPKERNSAAPLSHLNLAPGADLSSPACRPRVRQAAATAGRGRQGPQDLPTSF